MAEVKRSHAGELKKGTLFLIEGHPYKVLDVQTSKTGKHGHSKCRISAESVINGKKTVLVLPGSDPVDIPIVEKKSAQVLSVTGDMANVMDETTYETFDIRVPEELKDQVMAGSSVLFWEIMGEKVVKQVK
ncbi:translation initiation factor IF-5A [Candidatus Woesearchaeota archaeon]|nr:translation initiation factor IF-5A [Candidatus Woesearchaeota archaeon]